MLCCWPLDEAAFLVPLDTTVIVLYCCVQLYVEITRHVRVCLLLCIFILIIYVYSYLLLVFRITATE